MSTENFVSCSVCNAAHWDLMGTMPRDGSYTCKDCVRRLVSDCSNAEHYADMLASVILNEPIDWSDHEEKWKEAAEQNASLSDLRNRLSKLHATQHFGEYIVKPVGGESVVGWAIAEIQAAQVAIAHGKLLLESIDRFLAATQYVRGIERERKELVANANHFGGAIAGEDGTP